jgi:hypothetical protein
MDPLVMWHLHQTNKAWYLVVGNFLAWKALMIVKYDNAFYYQTIVKGKNFEVLP